MAFLGKTAEENEQDVGKQCCCSCFFYFGVWFVAIITGILVEVFADSMLGLYIAIGVAAFVTVAPVVLGCILGCCIVCRSKDEEPPTVLHSRNARITMEAAVNTAHQTIQIGKSGADNDATQSVEFALSPSSAESSSDSALSSDGDSLSSDKVTSEDQQNSHL